MTILKLPNELLCKVFETLGSIDDAQSLALVCSKTWGLFSESADRNRILKSIITSSPYHSHDLYLSPLVLVHEAFRREFYSDPQRLPDNFDRRKELMKQAQTQVTEQNISNDIIQDIIQRWYNMRYLFKLYCSSHRQYRFWDSDEWNRASDLSFCWDEHGNNRLPRTANQFRSYREMNAVQRQVSYQRFYKALTAHCFVIEKCWSLGAWVWDSVVQLQEAESELQELRRNNTSRSLPDKLDVLEVNEFLYGYLGAKSDVLRLLSSRCTASRNHPLRVLNRLSSLEEGWHEGGHFEDHGDGNDNSERLAIFQQLAAEYGDLELFNLETNPDLDGNALETEFVVDDTHPDSTEVPGLDFDNTIHIDPLDFEGIDIAGFDFGDSIDADIFDIVIDDRWPDALSSADTQLVAGGDTSLDYFNGHVNELVDEIGIFPYEAPSESDSLPHIEDAEHDVEQSFTQTEYNWDCRRGWSVYRRYWAKFETGRLILEDTNIIGQVAVLDELGLYQK